ncbi:MAG: DUF2461 domain-containing protein [Pseudomonadota bacterium]
MPLDQSFTPLAFSLLEALEANNEKVWYDANKAEFEAKLRAPFAEVLEAVTARLEGTIAPLIGSKKTMFRQNRDVRFSKDKSPYKTNISGLLTPSGTKGEGAGILYLHLDKTGGFMATGFYQFPTAKLGLIRDRIVGNPKRFSAMLESLEQHDLKLEMASSLSRMPRGYEHHAEHEHADYLKLKNFLVMEPLDRDAWTSGEVVEKATHLALASADFLGFCATALQKDAG